VIGKRGVWAVAPEDEIKITFDGGGGSITTGPANTFYTSATRGFITGWYLTGYPSGNLVLDVWKKNNDIPTVADSITGTEKPTLSNQSLANDVALASWNRQVLPGDVFGINIDSATVQNAVLTIRIQRT
jgi:hypothetical protein